MIFEMMRAKSLSTMALMTEHHEFQLQVTGNVLQGGQLRNEAKNGSMLEGRFLYG
jgi:hypothetical protein